MPYIAFIALIANDFEIFLKTFQPMKTRIHIVYPEMSKLLTSLMSKFIKSKLLRDDFSNAKSVSDLLTLNVKDTKSCKPLKLIDIGTKAKWSFPESRHNQYREEIPAKLFGGLSIVCFSFETEITMAINNLKKCYLPRSSKESG